MSTPQPSQDTPQSQGATPTEQPQAPNQPYPGYPPQPTAQPPYGYPPQSAQPYPGYPAQGYQPQPGQPPYGYPPQPSQPYYPPGQYPPQQYPAGQQPYPYGQQPYPPMMQPMPLTNPRAQNAMIYGFISIVLALIAFISGFGAAGFITGTFAIVYGVQSLNVANKMPGNPGKTQATVAIVLGSLAILIDIVALLTLYSRPA